MRGTRSITHPYVTELVVLLRSKSAFRDMFRGAGNNSDAQAEMACREAIRLVTCRPGIVVNPRRVREPSLRSCF
jgi:hypothetical protein